MAVATLDRRSLRLKARDYKTEVRPIWCPGCGDFGVLSALYQAMAQLALEPKDVVVVSGIGCSSRLPAFIKAYGFHSVHGRVLPTATGVKLANPELTVLGVGGDGDAFAIGGGHIPHAARRNVDITYIVMDNATYGLTKGQSSPTTALDRVDKANPYGAKDRPLNPVAMALAYHCSWVARGYSAYAKQLAALTVEAIQHPGFSFLQVISPCPTFNNIFRSFKQQTGSLEEDETAHDPSDHLAALGRAYDEQTQWLGVFHRELRPTLEDSLQANAEWAQERYGPFSMEAVAARHRP